MRMHAKRRSLTAGVLALGLLAAACGGSSGTGGDGSGGSGGVSGKINISGSSTVEPITSLVAENFAGQNPNVGPTVDGPGTSDGFVLFCKGETDINDASRQIDPEEAAACKANGVSWIELEIGLDGITVVTNPANTVDCLNFGDLYALFGPESKGFESWSDADQLAKQVGGNDNFPNAPLQIVAPGEESGTYGSFIELAIKAIAEERGKPDDQLRPDYQSSADDNVIIDNAESSPSGLGFVGFSYAQQAGAKVKELQVDGGNGCVGPSPDTVIDGSYPLSRSLYLYVNKQKLQSNPALAPFVDYYLSDPGIKAVTAVDYIALPKDRLAATRATWSRESPSA